MTGPVFLYGTLCDPDLYQIVAGTPFEGRAATLNDMTVYRSLDGSFPVLRREAGASLAGQIVAADGEARARLDFYELGFGYQLESCEVETDQGRTSASVYVPKIEWPSDGPWSFEDWQRQHAALARLAAGEYMGLMDTHKREAAARAFSHIRMRAASRLRAEATPSPEPLSPAMSGRQVIPRKTERPYTDYFAVQEDWLSFPTFDGGNSEEVKRASFLGGDAVTVLPYDPSCESVLMIRQFRHGPYARGDRNPWTLEPAAGRIDPGEAPEDTARRELLEETGVAARVLHLVGRYYPSPAAFSEYLYSYIAIADLSGADGGIGGLESEAEDIMRHVVPLDDAMGLIETGAVNTGPLLTSLAWLALNKSRVN